MVVVMKKSHYAQSDIHSVADLSSQSAVKYCVLVGSMAEQFFVISVDPVYARMWQQIQEDSPSSRVRSTLDGLDRVLTSTDEQPWAFVTLRSDVEYDAGQFCDLELVGDESIYRFLALALPLSSEYRDRLTLAVLEMTETGEIERLREKWWTKRDCDLAVDDDDDEEEEE